jgi:hypothetical protein
MRRILALAALAVGTTMTFAPLGAASASCDLTGNCACSAVNLVLRTAGLDELGCA